MAFPNILTQNPMKIGSVMTSPFKSAVAATLGSPFTLLVEKIQWEGATTAGHIMQIFDPQNGNDLAHMLVPTSGGTGTYFLDWTAHPRLWQDFIMAQLDSGTVYIYTRAG